MKLVDSFRFNFLLFYFHFTVTNCVLTINVLFVFSHKQNLFVNYNEYFSILNFLFLNYFRVTQKNVTYLIQIIEFYILVNESTFRDLQP